MKSTLKRLAVSIVVPCYNEIKNIRLCLDSLLALDYPSDLIEIIVVDGMSTDGTRELLEEYRLTRGVPRIVDNPERITPAAMNRGIRAALHNYILIASAHSSFAENYLSVLMEAMISLNADVVGGLMQTRYRNDTPTAHAIGLVLSTKFGVGNSAFRTGAVRTVRVDTVPYGLYRKDIMLKAGLYNEKLVRNQDIEFSKRIIRVGGTIYLVPRAVCAYYARDTVGGMVRNNFENGYWNLLTIYITKRIASLSVRHFVPLIFLLSIVIPLISSRAYFPFLYVSGAILIFYIVAFTFISMRIVNSSTSALRVFACFFLLHASYGAGSLLGLLRVDKLIDSC